MKSIFLLILCLAAFRLADAQTYYYERVAVVRNGQKTTASGDGHFITFTSKGCYDSDNKGMTEDFGFVEYRSTSNDIRNYYGDSYFGKAYYFFNYDRSRLNIKKESDGTVYVYSRKIAPVGVVKSSRQKASSGNIVPLPAATVVIPAVGGTTPSYNPLPSSTPINNQGRRCPSCSGTGNCTMCHGKGWYKNTYDSDYYSCPSCGGSGRCKVCYGKGTIY